MAWSSDAIDGDVAEQRAWGKPPGGGRPYDGERFDEVGGGEAPRPAHGGRDDRTDRDRSPDSVLEPPDVSHLGVSPPKLHHKGVLKRAHSEPSYAPHQPAGRDPPRGGAPPFPSLESGSSAGSSSSSSFAPTGFDEDMSETDSPYGSATEYPKQRKKGSCGDLTDALERARTRGARPEIRKSVSFHTTVTMVRSESLTALPTEEKHRIWYRSSDYSKFVHSELGRRKEMGVTSTSLIMPSSIAHREPSLENLSDDEDDIPMDTWANGVFADDDDCASDDSRDDDDRDGPRGSRRGDDRDGGAHGDGAGPYRHAAPSESSARTATPPTHTKPPSTSTSFENATPTCMSPSPSDAHRQPTRRPLTAIPASRHDARIPLRPPPPTEKVGAGRGLAVNLTISRRASLFSLPVGYFFCRQRRLRDAVAIAGKGSGLVLPRPLLRRMRERQG